MNNKIKLKKRNVVMEENSPWLRISDIGDITHNVFRKDLY
jgi:hypothetical protein